MLTTVLNMLIFMRIAGLRLAHEAGWDGFGPLIIGLAIVGLLIGALSRTRQMAAERIELGSICGGLARMK